MAVLAIKNGKKQIFSDLAWQLLGKNKNGWVAQETTAKISNSVEVPVNNGANTTPPDMGVNDKEELEKKETIDNNAEPKKEVEVPAENNTNPKESEFLTAVAGISRAAIKDYFDKNNVKYKNKSDDKALQAQLAKHLNYDIVELQKAFA